MNSSRRKLLILVALLGVWGLLFAFRAGQDIPTRLPAPEKAMPTRTPAAQGGGLPRLKTGLLHLPLPAYPPEVQDIFGTQPPPRPVEATATPASPPPPPPDPFQEEAKRLRYVGFLRVGDTAMAFIAQGSEVHTLEVGATLGERFRLQAVTEDAILLSSPAGDKQVRLPLAAEVGPSPKR